MERKSVLTGVLNEHSASAARLGMLRITYIPYERLRPSPLNGYEVQGIDKLAENIESEGLINPLYVQIADNDGIHEILSGHRRHAAIGLLRETCPENWSSVPCIIGKPREEWEKERAIIFSNLDNRVKTDAEKVYEAERLRIITEHMKALGEKLGMRQREYVSKATGASFTQVERYERISRNLIQDWRNVFDAGKIRIPSAYNLARLSHEDQSIMFDAYTETGKIDFSILDDLAGRGAGEAQAPSASSAVRDMQQEIAEEHATAGAGAIASIAAEDTVEDHAGICIGIDLASGPDHSVTYEPMDIPPITDAGAGEDEEDTEPEAPAKVAEPQRVHITVIPSLFAAIKGGALIELEQYGQGGRMLLRVEEVRG